MKRFVFYLFLLFLLLLFFARWGLLLLIHKDRPVCALCGQAHVIHDYYRATGITRRVEVNDINITKQIYGEPQYVNEELVPGDSSDYYVFLHYDGFSIFFITEDHEFFEYCGFELYSPNRRIRKDIGVGSTREEIITAYRRCPSIEAWKNNGWKKGDELWDSGSINFFGNILEFEYDDNDIVQRIRYYPGDSRANY